jgi:hypothetical protein
VTDTYFDAGSDKYVYDTNWAYYGFGSFLFIETSYDQMYGDDFWYRSAFRFIGAEENGGNRWSVGDTIDLFYLDFENGKFTENNEHELLGAATLTLTAAGITLFSTVLM